MLSREESVGKQILACANLLSFGSAIEDRRELGGEEHEASQIRETASTGQFFTFNIFESMERIRV